jgi:glutaconate CoA-transferase subunit A
VPYLYVAAVAQVPWGAHPTACYPMYGYDREHTAAYYKAASAGEEAFKTGYMEPFIDGCATHEDYIARIGGDERCAELAGWSTGSEAWMKLYGETVA